MSTSIRPSFQLTLLCSACLVAALAWLHPLPSLGNDPSSKDLDVVLANPNDLLMQARVIPAIPNGVPQGFKIFSIRPDSLYSRLGPQSGGMEPAPANPAPGISVQQVGPQDNELSRKDLDVVLANPNDLLMQAHVIPAIHNGVPQGLKIFSIRPGSLYSLLGLQNGDVLLRLNGLSLGSVERGLEAFQTLRDASRIELEVDRNGQLMRLTYSPSC